MLKIGKQTCWLTSAEELHEDVVRCLHHNMYNSKTLSYYGMQKIRQRLNEFYNVMLKNEVTEFHIIYSDQRDEEFIYESVMNNIVPIYVLKIDELKDTLDTFSRGMYMNESILFTDSYKNIVKQSNNLIVLATKNKNYIVGAFHIRPYILPQQEYSLSVFTFENCRLRLDNLTYSVYEKIMKNVKD